MTGHSQQIKQVTWIVLVSSFKIICPWQEECSQGYWDDFKELKDSGGKVFQASTLIAARAAPLVPSVEVNHPDLKRKEIKESQKSRFKVPCAVLVEP